MLFVEQTHAVIGGLDAAGDAAVIVHGKKERAHTGRRAASNAGAFRGGAVTARGRRIGATTACAAPARPSSATVLRGGLTSREKREGESKNEPNEILENQMFPL